MEFNEVVYKRRSIRAYNDKDVPDDLILEILRSGMAAPSAGNEQPWHFILLKNKSIFREIQKVHPYSQMLNEAFAAIIVCADLGLEKHEGYWIQDLSAAVQNMLLSITANGLAGVWLGVYPREDRVSGIKKLFNLPETIMPFAIIPFGYSDVEPKYIDRFQEDRIHLEKW